MTLDAIVWCDRLLQEYARPRKGFSKQMNVILQIAGPPSELSQVVASLLPCNFVLCGVVFRCFSCLNPHIF